MSQHSPDGINRLVGDFMDLQEQWENDRENFDWRVLQELAQRSVHAYNEGAGPSFQALALDGMRHNEFHERFLSYLLQAGFDPFHLSSAGSGAAEIPVIDHASLAEAAESNPFSARMRSMLMDLARKHFEPLARDVESGMQASAAPLFPAAKACAESIPEDLMQRIAPELVAQVGAMPSRQQINPTEGYLSAAEVETDNSRRPYG
ncbi:hypothetical protein ACFQUU_07405 [Herbaspirillum sp. GCM10030257]|uniref:hypothetical protein n=1 Tax=Herbaspirillum sp. GCM10030257 TaxID=3273393 RepID=UPI00361D1A4D